MNDLLSIVGLVIERQNNRVRNDIIDEVRPHCAWEPQIVHLNWRRAKRADAGSRIHGITRDIDDDIDTKIAQEPRHIFVPLRSDINELIEASHQPRPHLAAVIDTERYSDDLEPRPVVPLEQFSHEMRNCMTMKIGGEIRDLDFVVAPGLAVAEPLRRRDNSIPSKTLRT